MFRFAQKTVLSRYGISGLGSQMQSVHITKLRTKGCRSFSGDVQFNSSRASVLPRCLSRRRITAVKCGYQWDWIHYWPPIRRLRRPLHLVRIDLLECSTRAGTARVADDPVRNSCRSAVWFQATGYGTPRCPPPVVPRFTNPILKIHPASHSNIIPR